jgi:hypothetical protein
MVEQDLLVQPVFQDQLVPLALVELLVKLVPLVQVELLVKLEPLVQQVIHIFC